eukprot:scaffold5014_cov387-Prasinococcus_capsulatus_cf.AAC.18
MSISRDGLSLHYIGPPPGPEDAASGHTIGEACRLGSLGTHKKQRATALRLDCLAPTRAEKRRGEGGASGAPFLGAAAN